MPSAAVPTDASREFIEGIQKGLEDLIQGNYMVFKDADELLAYLLSP